MIRVICLGIAAWMVWEWANQPLPALKPKLQMQPHRGRAGKVVFIPDGPCLFKGSVSMLTH